MLEFREIHTSDELGILGDMKLSLMNYHKGFAEKCGIADVELSGYSLEQALCTADVRISFLFYLDDVPVGMSQVQEQISNVDKESILFVHSIYIESSAQHQNIGAQFLKYLCHRFKKRIECECWYDIPAGKIYERLGFFPMVTRFVLPLTSHFYGSDQN